jgi:hypothetical protein
VIYDLKAEVGTIKNGLEAKGILVDSAPDHKQDGKGYPHSDRQRPKFAGIAKKTSLSLVPNREIKVTDSNEEQEEEEQAQLAMVVPVVKKILTIYRGRNASLSSMMQYDHVDLHKESLNPLSQYPTDGQIKNVMMKDTTSSALSQEQSPHLFRVLWMVILFKGICANCFSREYARTVCPVARSGTADGIQGRYRTA